jgi:hypothetical protein
MFDDIRIVVDATKAVKAPVPLPCNDPRAVLLDGEEIDRFDIGRRRLLLVTNHAWDLSGKLQPYPASVPLAGDNLDAPLLLKGLQLRVRGPFGHGLALLPDPARHPAARRLEADHSFVVTDETCVPKKVQVDCLLVRIETWSKMILELSDELLEIYRGRSLLLSR